jgi:hypothetical protein
MNSWGCALQCLFCAAANSCFSVIANVRCQLTRYKIRTNVYYSAHRVRVAAMTSLVSMTSSDRLRRSQLSAPAMPSNCTRVACSCRVRDGWESSSFKLATRLGPHSRCRCRHTGTPWWVLIGISKENTPTSLSFQRRSDFAQIWSQRWSSLRPSNQTRHSMINENFCW